MCNAVKEVHLGQACEGPIYFASTQVAREVWPSFVHDMHRDGNYWFNLVHSMQSHKRCQPWIVGCYYRTLLASYEKSKSLSFRKVWSWDWNLKELTKGHHKEWSLWLNLTIFFLLSGLIWLNTRNLTMTVDISSA